MVFVWTLDVTPEWPRSSAFYFPEHHAWEVRQSKLLCRICSDMLWLLVAMIHHDTSWYHWWFGTFFIFPYTGNIVIPLFFRGVQTTNQTVDLCSSMWFATWFSEPMDFRVKLSDGRWKVMKTDGEVQKMDLIMPMFLLKAGTVCEFEDFEALNMGHQWNDSFSLGLQFRVFRAPRVLPPDHVFEVRDNDNDHQTSWNIMKLHGQLHRQHHGQTGTFERTPTSLVFASQSLMRWDLCLATAMERSTMLLIGKPSISIRAIYTMAMLVITRG